MRLTRYRFITPPSPGLEREVLVRCRVGVAGDETEPRLVHAGPGPVDEAQLPDRREHGLIVDELLELDQIGLALLAVRLLGLLLEEAVDVGVATVGEGATASREALDAGGGASEGGAGGLDDVAKLLLPVLGEEGR